MVVHLKNQLLAGSRLFSCSKQKRPFKKETSFTKWNQKDIKKFDKYQH